MKQGFHVGRPSRGIVQWLGTWKWQIVLSAAALLAIGLVAWAGLRSTPTFFGDCAANFVADAIVAGIAFLLATVAFGYWERRRQETEARQKALLILRKELASNLRMFEVLIAWAREGGEIFQYEYNDWVQEDSGLETSSWQLLVQSGLALALPHDVWLSVQDSYATSTDAMRNLYRRANEAVRERRTAWSELVEACLPGLEGARDLTRDALAKLESGLP